MINLKKINEEIYYSTDPISRISSDELCFLKGKVASSERRRVRICLHPCAEDSLHEMLIVLARGVDVLPHKHIRKSESFHVIEGSLKVVFFDDSGIEIESVYMGEVSSGLTFFYRLSKPLYHTVIPLSEIVVFHETTNGPFRKEDLILAPWCCKQ